MIVHLGLCALLAAVAAWALRRGGRRSRAGLVLGALALAAAGVEGWILVRGAGLRSGWESIAARELTGRTERIVSFLREEGSGALDDIRSIGRDGDTRALLSSARELARSSRGPVFGDLLERFPSRGPAGVAIYDADGEPRAWSGWTATATMSPAREPSPDAEVVEIRKGNIYTLLQVTHPVVGVDPALRTEGASEESVLGFVFYQKPLRVQFPLRNRFLRVEDRLQRLVGPGGARADVSLELALKGGGDISEIAPGPLKLDIRDEEAYCTAAIVTDSGQSVGRVSLSGLSRAEVITHRLAGAHRLRTWLLLAVGLLVAVRCWFAAGDLRHAFLVRTGIVVAARAALHVWNPGQSVSFLGVFDSGVYSLSRYDGLLRSPGDLLLTAAAFAAVAREARRTCVVHRGALERLGRRRAVLAIPAGAAAAALVGSVAGLHWERTVDIVRNANAPLYAALDPFTSAPVAILELALLLGGTGFLLFGDALVTLALTLFSRVEARVSALAVWGLAAFASAVKVGAASDHANLGHVPTVFQATGLPADLLRVAATLAALFALHRVLPLWRSPGVGAILVTAGLAAAANFTALAEATDVRRRAQVALFAHRHVEAREERETFLRSMLSYFAAAEDLREVLRSGPVSRDQNLAFILWARSGLSSAAAGSRLRILGETGHPVSTFTFGFPPDVARSREGAPALPSTEIAFRREEIGSTPVDVYTGRASVLGGRRRLGTVELTMTYLDDLRGQDPALSSVFTNLTAPDEYLQFAREIPHRIDRYRGGRLVYSTAREEALGTRLQEGVARQLESSPGQGDWVSRLVGTESRRTDFYGVRERDGQITVGHLFVGVERFGALWAGGLLARSGLVSLVLGVLLIGAAVVLARAQPARAPRIVLFHPGFRERVIGGIVLVALLPTVLLGFAGRRLFSDEKRQEFQERLDEDLRLSRQLVGRRVADAATNAAGSEEVLACLADPATYRTLSSPQSVQGILVLSSEGRVLASSPAADQGIAAVPGKLPATERPLEFFRRRGGSLYACALAPARTATGRGGAVMAIQPIDRVLAADLERRIGSAVSFFSGGVLTATSKPELYQAEMLSDLAESEAYLAIELQDARRASLESRVGGTSFLASYAPLPDENGDPIGIVSTLAAFRGGGLDREASRVLSLIYFVCLAVFTVAIGAAVVLANRLTRPIAQLTAGAERIGAGSFGHEIRARASGEIGALVRSFNSMSRRLAAAEAQDRERREYIEAVIRNVGSGVISFDADGTVATVNEAAMRVLGAAEGEIAGRSLAEIRGGAALTAVLDASRPLVAGDGRAVETELEVLGGGSEEGELRSIRLVGTPLVNNEGKFQGAVIVFEDLTDLIKSKKITAWAEMARQVAHEIKNPLTPMKLSAQHLLQAWRDQHPKLDEIVVESAETIVDRCEALRRIAIEFSDYARMPGRKIRREDLGLLLHEARRLYAEPGDRQVEFALAAPREELYTRVDKDEVMRLFINLIENSIQAMPRGGKLDVSAWAENGGAHVTIQDTGVGIRAEDLARIFEPSFSTKTGGAGLGLPICKAIMEDYGGTISIRSAPGHGTTVTLVFPADERPAA